MTTREAITEELTVTARRVEDEVSTVRGRGGAANGNIEVEVDALGAITELRVSEVATRQLTTSALASAIVAAQHDACRSARATAGIIRDKLLNDPRVVQIMAELDAARRVDPSHSEIPAPKENPRIADEESFYRDPLRRR
ncbi:hypothetical protein FFI94_030070 [Rhodococcus sp. KBS0724]|uniref:YbaB/EbfC family nucleoid-associated protein n=1 Tax=Rhodococcus sp. KBS0724 TaxID=1179674 RepID=UPI00110E1FCF|nr:YbaB/EbfC family nucleoid-associated protein [Rhodococcus sp. KBS0724]TSD49978.1 hypothetical protein FFI94_030070 [Rhodococcus sp. KBS0724]